MTTRIGPEEVKTDFRGGKEKGNLGYELD